MTTIQQDREFISQVINPLLLEAAIHWIGRNLGPGEVFDDGTLRDWAIENGMVDADQ